MGQLLYLLYLPYKWLFLLPVFVLATGFFATLAVVLALVAGPRIGSLVGGTGWARLMAFLTPMWVTVEGREHVDDEQSYVVVANHQSSYDIFVVYGWLGMDFKWVMKAELRKWPALGFACETLKHVFVDRSDTAAAIRSIHQARERIREGTSVVFFPEGTRSMSGQLLPFKKGAFRMAIDLGLPILPVTIAGSRDVMPARTLKLFPGGARLIFHPPIDAAGYDQGDLRELMAEVKAAVASALPSQREAR